MYKNVPVYKSEENPSKTPHLNDPTYNLKNFFTDRGKVSPVGHNKRAPARSSSARRV